MSLYALYVALTLVVTFFVFAIRILREYERGVIFQLGRFWKVKGPGLIIVIPVIQQMVRVDLRTVVMDVPSQDVISRDNVSVKVNAVIYFRVIDPEKAIIQVEDFLAATSQLAQTTLRSVLGQHELDDMLAEREKLNRDIQELLDAHFPASMHEDILAAVGMDLETGTQSLEVQGVFEDGQELYDYYSGKEATVTKGKVSVETEAGLVLLGARNP